MTNEDRMMKIIMKMVLMMTIRKRERIRTKLSSKEHLGAKTVRE